MESENNVECKNNHEALISVKKEMSRLLQLAKSFNTYKISDSFAKGYHPFVVEGIQVGLVRPDILKHMLHYSSVFKLRDGNVVLDPALNTYVERTNKVNEVLLDLKSKKELSTLDGWRNENYEVRSSFISESLFNMDRSATCLFGICNYGVSINGYIQDPERGLCIWLQRRSYSKQRWAGKWDNMVGGGVSCGFSISETAIKEAEEEASIPFELMKNLQSCGSVSFFFENEQGLFPDTEFVFDLELPCDFKPENKDGEVEEFELLTAKDALERAFSPTFKTTSCAVLIDFFVRKGFIRPESDTHYLEVLELLHVPLQTFYGRRV